jgi:regulatory protein YycH of two-component signal transduction system YycFG
MNEQQKQEILATAIKRAEFETKLVIKAMEDESFRQALFDNSKIIYAQEIGTPLPDSLSVEVVEESATKVYLRLPSKSINTEVEEELSDEALEAIAGGGWALFDSDWVIVVKERQPLT